MNADDIFKPTDMASILSAAILEKLSTDEREAMLAQALAYLMTPGESKDFGRTPGKTPVQAAFDLAAGSMIQQVTWKILDENPEFQAKLRELVTNAVTAAIEGDESFQSAVAQGVSKALADRRY